MSDADSRQSQPTAVDDVRKVREAIAAEHKGDLRAHMEETNRLFEQLQGQMNLKLVPLPKAEPRRDGTRG